MRGATPEGEPNDVEIFNPFQVIPFCIAAHEKKSEWAQLKTLVKDKKGFARGLGIPAGGGLIYYPDLSLEAVKQPVQELIYNVEENTLVASLIMPLALDHT